VLASYYDRISSQTHQRWQAPHPQHGAQSRSSHEGSRQS
jgi:hypothetical protein